MCTCSECTPPRSFTVRACAFLRISFHISSESKKANLFVPFTASKERNCDVSWQGISGPRSGGFPCPWSISAVSQNKAGQKQGINPAEIQAPPLRTRFDLRGGAPEWHVSGFPGWSPLDPGTVLLGPATCVSVPAPPLSHASPHASAPACELNLHPF